MASKTRKRNAVRTTLRAVGVFLVHLGLFREPAQATPSERFLADFAGLETANFKIMSVADCNADWVKSELARQSLLEEVQQSDNFMQPFEWTPSGAPFRLEDRNCEPERLQNLVFSRRASTRGQASALHDFFLGCDQSLRWDMPSGPKAVISMTQTAYRYCEHPNIRKVVMRLGNGDVVRGILALKPGSTPRPLIIAKCGVMCNAGDSAMRFLVMHLYDESPFHLLVLSNSTGPDFIRDNRYFVPGGLREGQQFLYAAKMMRQSSLAKRISTIHAMGVSLGGHAALFAAYMAPFQTGAAKRPVLQSVLAACPVVDLRVSINDLFQWFSIKGTIAQILFGNGIDKVLATNPELGPLFDWWNAFRHERPQRMAEQSAKYLASQKRGWNLPPFENLALQTAEDFWNYNQIAKLAKKPFTTPTLALAAADDEVVNPWDNTRVLAQAGFPATIIPAGDHCAFSQMYGWRMSSALYRGFFLSQSPELTQKRKAFSIKIPQDLLDSASDANNLTVELHGVTRFNYTAGVDGFKVTHQYFTTVNDAGCADQNTRFAGAHCYRDVSFVLPFSRLAQRPWWAHAPSSAAEADALTRWANVNLKAVDQSGKLVDDTSALATQLRWMSYDGDY